MLTATPRFSSVCKLHLGESMKRIWLKFLVLEIRSRQMSNLYQRIAVKSKRWSKYCALDFKKGLRKYIGTQFRGSRYDVIYNIPCSLLLIIKMIYNCRWLYFIKYSSSERNLLMRFHLNRKDKLTSSSLVDERCE